ncbi:MAG: Tn7 transposase TnsA N-terminal domain-containing protein [Rhodospirillales bacterium]|nr:Tn7 transposase TnsA N-terminal domain-containing protein [Rhodospirillales bacterium]
MNEIVLGNQMVLWKRRLSQVQLLKASSMEIAVLLKSAWPEKDPIIADDLQDEFEHTNGKPVRNVVTKSSARSKGYFASEKSKEMNAWESFTEYKFMCLLECDPTVKSFYSQPIQVSYPWIKGRRRHTPDFLSWREDGPHITEIKWAKEAGKPENVERFQFFRDFFRQFGIAYHVCDQHVINLKPRLSNCQELIRHRGRGVSYEQKELVQGHLEHFQESSVSELADLLAHPDGEEIVYAMVLRGHIAIDHNMPIGQESRVQLVKGGRVSK